ncbi:hypothetical protein BH23PLA1_BH23PLA1_23480 [soil metagenome]
MDRQQREAELHQLLTSPRGKEEMMAILKKHAGMEEGNLPPLGTLLVETILNFEFPPVEETEEKPPQAPGDEKFEEPPGREAQGG